MKCKQLIHLGVYHPSSRFFFVVNLEDKELEKIFHYNDYLYRHSQVGILQPTKTLDPEKAMYKILGYNFYFKENGLPEVNINHVWTTETPFKSIKDAFTDMKHFQGKHFRIATNPWSHHVQADSIPKEDPEYSESNKYR